MNPLTLAALLAHITPADLAIRSERWQTRMTLPRVERLLADPASTFETASAWRKEIDDARSSAALIALSARLLDIPQAKPAENESLLSAVAAAKADLARSVASLGAEERAAAREFLKPSLISALDEPWSADLAPYEKFDLGPLFAAALRIAGAAGIMTDRPPRPAGQRWREGSALYSTEEDAFFSAHDLAGVDILVHWGKRARYAGPLAAARENEVKVALDFAPEVELSSGGASGEFGIGLVYLPNAAGSKVLSGDDFTLGSGFFGVGGLFIKGKAELRAGRFAQGAGAFGAGLLSVEGADARYALRYAGQGFGWTRGVGLLRHAGDRADLDGGTVDPDPHEALAATSLSQGVGVGPRAFAAGGIGLAWIHGNAARLRASYMAQGTGYWHGFGGLFVSGDDNSIQGRRYVQGAGIHVAAGAFLLAGQRNKTACWGVGPGMGWDQGVGAFDAVGDENYFSSEWASGRGDVNGHGLARVRGKKNRLALGDFGSGAWKRSAPSYGLAKIKGEGNIYALPWSSAAAGPFTLSLDPWGAVLGDAGARIEPDLAAEKISWPALDRQAAFARDRAKLARWLAKGDRADGARRVSLWLAAAAEESSDPETSFHAAERLAGLPDADAPLLLAAVSAEDFGGYIWLRTMIPAFGGELAAPLAAKIERAAGTQAAVLLDLARFLPARQAWPILAPRLDSSDWRARRAALGALGGLLGRQKGDEPGRLAFIEATLAFCRRPPALDSKEEQEWIKGLGRQWLSTLYSTLALDGRFSSAERLALLQSAPNPFDPASAATLKTFAKILRDRPARYADLLAGELASSSEVENQARARLRDALRDPDADMILAALASLGGIARPDDAPALAPFLSHASATVRQAAAINLGRMGEAGRKELAARLASGQTEKRALAALGLAYSDDPAAFAALSPALADSDENVRRAALSSLIASQDVMKPYLARFKEAIVKLEKDDPSLSVRLAARRARLSITP